MEYVIFCIMQISGMQINSLKSLSFLSFSLDRNKYNLWVSFTVVSYKSQKKSKFLKAQYRKSEISYLCKMFFGNSEALRYTMFASKKKRVARKSCNLSHLSNRVSAEHKNYLWIEIRINICNFTLSISKSV